MYSHTSDEIPPIRPPRWLVVATIVLVAQLTASVGVELQATDVSRMLLGILLAGLLLWGSRVAWIAILLGALYQITSSAVDGAYWNFIAGTAITVALFAPSSIRYVWVARTQQVPKWAGQHTLEFYVRIRTAAYTGAHWLIGWDDGEAEHELRQRSYRVGLWRVGLACLLLVLLGGVAVNWQESTGGDSLLLGIVEDAIWVCYVFAQLVFIVLVVLAVRSVFAKRRVPGRF